MFLIRRMMIKTPVICTNLDFNFKNNNHSTNRSNDNISDRYGYVQRFGNNYMLYNNKNAMIGNIKAKRYHHLKHMFCKYYNIKDENVIESNETIQEFWNREIHRMTTDYKYKQKKYEIYKHSRMESSVIESFCNTLDLHNLENFTPFNIPMKSERHFISNKHSIFGSKHKQIGGSYFINNIISYNSLQNKSHELNALEPYIPSRNVICIPLLSFQNISHLIDDKHIMCIIPKNTMVMKTPDNWYDIEYKDILNRYPIGIYLLCNEVSLDVSPIHTNTLKELEQTINATLINTSISLNKNIHVYKNTNNNPVKCHTQLNDVVYDTESIYTDASIRTVDSKYVAGIGIWFGSKNEKNVSQRFEVENINDINFCELFAIYLAIIKSDPNKEIHIHTDSMTSMKLLEEGFLHNSIQNKKYETPVMKILSVIKSRKHKTRIFKVKAHHDDLGNNNADYMARSGVYNNTDIPFNIIDFVN